MRRSLVALPIVLALVAPGCSAGRAQAARHLGLGLTAEGVGVALVAAVTRDPEEGVLDAAQIAAPLLIAGLVTLVAGHFTR